MTFSGENLLFVFVYPFFPSLLIGLKNNTQYGGICSLPLIIVKFKSDTEMQESACKIPPDNSEKWRESTVTHKKQFRKSVTTQKIITYIQESRRLQRHHYKLFRLFCAGRQLPINSEYSSELESFRTKPVPTKATK